MPGLILPRRFNQQPQQLPQIDQNNPLARSLALAVSPAGGSFYDAAQRRIGTRNGISHAAGAGGVGYVAASNASVGIQFAGSKMFTSDGAGTGDFTYLVVANPIASNTREFFVVCQNGATEFYFGANLFVGLAAGSGIVSAQTNGAGTTGRDAAASVDGALHTYIYMRGGSTGTLYFDGRNVSSGAVAANQMWSATSADIIGGYTGAGWGISNGLFLTLGWNRALSAAEVAQITANPWQMFKAPARRLFAAATGGAATYSYTAAGGFVLSGSATKVRRAVRNATGGTQLGGAASVSRGAVKSAAGGVTLSGAATIARRVVKAAAGGIRLAGAAATSVGAAQSRILTAVGGIIISGAGAIRRGLARIAAAGFKFGGTSPVTVSVKAPKTAIFCQSTLIRTTVTNCSVAGRTTSIASNGGMRSTLSLSALMRNTPTNTSAAMSAAALNRTANLI